MKTGSPDAYARIRRIEITNFRSIQRLDWFPHPGINAIIGSGDSGKSSVLDAIEWCIGARNSVPVTDADFHNVDTEKAISITVTVGDLSGRLLNLESYGSFFRHFDAETSTIDDEPLSGAESVLTINLTIQADLQPIWSLVSESAAEAGKSRMLRWEDRTLVHPSRLGNYIASQLSWSRGSILHKLTAERTQTGPALAQAARNARSAFGRITGSQFEETLDAVKTVAGRLGLAVGDTPHATLDAHNVSLTDGAIALHDTQGVPLRSLGTGSSRLLTAGLQRFVAEEAGSSILLVDEVEHGLEPHRIRKLLGEMGYKEAEPAIQTFLTTHSPVVLLELGTPPLHVLRRKLSHHQILKVAADTQGTLRTAPDAFLAESVIVCEGATEVGFVRGLDQHLERIGKPTLFSHSVTAIDIKGGGPDSMILRGVLLAKLGYRVAVFIDADKPASAFRVQELEDLGGRLFTWRTPRTTEGELFQSLAAPDAAALLARAYELNPKTDDHIKSKSSGKLTYASALSALQSSGPTESLRQTLGDTAHACEWFKSVGKMEDAVRDIIGPGLKTADQGFSGQVAELIKWVRAC
ncbi:AAA family ATPase [Caenimonas koreensis DSM 17982]|uniref:AAA family ATPase n=1 Tax=Caenimonas koreensis DSM 17982 TaxID=1121255 RepID=A0A844B057_9BURK|nr:AAA family ATPase [Caenimonas koreensis DSM 17982]